MTRNHWLIAATAVGAAWWWWSRRRAALERAGGGAEQAPDATGGQGETGGESRYQIGLPDSDPGTPYYMPEVD